MAVFPAVFGLLMASLVTAQNVEVTPKQAAVQLGKNITIIAKVPYEIDSCVVKLGGEIYNMRPGTTKEGDVIYAGQGFNNGECGVEIKRVKAEMNGLVVFTLPKEEASKLLEATMTLIVAKAPEYPQLFSPGQPIYREGDLLLAQCVVPNGRPAARISWYLDNEQVFEGLHEPIKTTAPDTGLETISQNITMQLTPDHAGRILKCVAEHEAFDQPQTAQLQIIVHYHPQRVDMEGDTITIFGLKLGSEGRLNVTVRANPEPRAEWAVAGERLTAPQNNHDNTVTALTPLQLGRGYYNVTLVIHELAKEHVDQTFLLTLTNEIGSESVNVRISTMDEPAGVELGTGAIVGIVIAVLILLITVFLIVFAKATDRWCFGGRSHRTDIPDGVDSEAPLPPHDDVKGSENPSHDHGDYISNGNSKHPEKKPDTAV